MNWIPTTVDPPADHQSRRYRVWISPDGKKWRDADGFYIEPNAFSPQGRWGAVNHHTDCVITHYCEMTAPDVADLDHSIVADLQSLLVYPMTVRIAANFDRTRTVIVDRQTTELSVTKPTLAEALRAAVGLGERT